MNQPIIPLVRRPNCLNQNLRKITDLHIGLMKDKKAVPKALGLRTNSKNHYLVRHSCCSRIANYWHFNRSMVPNLAPGCCRLANQD